MKRTVYALGEALLDILFKQGQVMQAVPGGSVLNTAVSLGRMGIDVQLLSEFGSDQAGMLIRSFLLENRVSVDWTYNYPENKTSLALAFLNENKNASYSFYHDIPETLHINSKPELMPDDILLFGSFYSLKEQRRAMVKEIVDSAKRSGSLIVYDPNIRLNHLSSLGNYMHLIVENFSSASIVKGSDEDFFNIFGTDNPDDTYEKVQPYCKNLLISRGSKNLILMTPSYKASFAVPSIEPVSTIGAGDNLNAGLIYGMLLLGVTRKNIDSISASSWERISNYGIEFAKATCLSEENYIPLGFNPEIARQA
ncbi:MAG: carbohydrate kinase [Bacteroidetes bacterium]|nr:carbohydrate kinase [Bacteroidota bacterium]